MPADDRQPEPHVGDAARHHALDGHELHRRARVLGRDHRRVRDAAGRRLDRGDPAAVRGVAQRAADVVAEPERATCPKPARTPRRRWSRRRSRPGPTGCGSARAATSRCGCAGRGPGRFVRPIGIAPAARRRSTCGASIGRDRLGQRRDAGRGRRAGDVDVLLDRERHAVQRAASARSGVGRVGRRPRLVGQHHRDRVQVRRSPPRCARGARPPPRARRPRRSAISSASSPAPRRHSSSDIDARLLLLGNACREPRRQLPVWPRS